MKRLLAVSWEMPPMYGPRASQVAATLTALPAHGWMLSAICLAPVRGGPHWPDGAPAVDVPGVDLIKVPSPEESLVWRAAARVAPVLRRFPDNQRLWIGAAVAAARRQIAQHPFEGVITFAQPWSDHLIGLRLKASARLPWVAHFSDPWVDSPYLHGAAWQRRIWAGMERSVIDHADAVVFVTEETADLVMRKYPADWRRKVAVVPHGFVAAGASAERSPRMGGPMRIVYTGRFYRDVRTPLALFHALALLPEQVSLAGRLELVLMGPTVEEFRRDATALGVERLVRFEPRRSKDEASRAAADADVLLVIDAPSSGPSPFLPSKLVDYLAFRKPILGLTPREGASARLLERLECPVVAPDDVSAIADAVSALLARRQSGRLGVAASFDAVASEFDIRRTTAQLDDVLVRTFARTS
jgi:glycosyltransferase involved in cell wall biosynthesis